MARSVRPNAPLRKDLRAEGIEATPQHAAKPFSLFQLDALSLIAAIVAGIAAAIAWRTIGFAALVNEAAVGIGAGIAVNFVVARVSVRD